MRARLLLLCWVTQRSCHVFCQTCWDVISAGAELDVDLSAAGWQCAGRGEGRDGNVLAGRASGGRSGDAADQAEIWEGNAGRGVSRNPGRFAITVFGGSQGPV